MWHVMLNELDFIWNGGPGSGFHGHYGRPGERGGSSSNKCVPADAEAIKSNKFMKDIDTNKLSAYEGKMLAKAAKGGNISPKEAEKMTKIKACIRELNATKEIKPEDRPELVEQVKKEFRDEIMKQAEEYGGAKQDYKFSIITGLPGAGKTSAGVEELRKQGYLEVDNDIAKKVPALAKYNKGGAGAGVVQEICSAARKQLVAELLKEGYNVIYPGTGDKYKKVSRDLTMFKDAGYKADGPAVRYVEVSNATAVTRAIIRTYTDGRYTGLNYITGMGDNPKKVIQQLEAEGYTDANTGAKFKISIEKHKND